MIVARDLTKRLGTKKALQSVDLTVGDGEKLIIFGPNGAGKTTLLRLIAGLSRPTSGTVSIDGSEPRHRRAALGYLGHEPYLFGHLSAAENLEFYADLYGVSRKTATSSLQLVGITHQADALVSQLSRGETRRVALARALFHDPAYLLLDEPFSNLDEHSADVVLSLVGAPGRTVLLVTHDRTRAAAVGGRSISLQEGRLCDPRPADRSEKAMPGGDRAFGDLRRYDPEESSR